MNIRQLIRNEGWQIRNVKTETGVLIPQVEVYGRTFPLAHPFSIHGKLYRESDNPEIKYKHFKKMHDYAWPDTLWHSWTEDRFRAHCSDYKFMTWAGGGSSAKSFDAAKIALLFWLADQRGRTCVVASTTLESLSGRIWGYITMLIRTAKLDLKFTYYTAKPPKILHHKHDSIHGMFAVAAKRGDDETSIREWIGRHPKNALMVILDECTDMPPAILGAVANLETAPWFQLLGIGNSSSKNDTHGALSTPKAGWKSVDPLRDKKWETTQDRGICLFFSCYDSPAIHEPNLELRKKLGKFLITEKEIVDRKKTWGETSDSFYRFVLGFWKEDSTDETVISSRFLAETNVKALAEWSGLYPIAIVAGLDPSFSTGGDGCILRLAQYGHTSSGQMVLDYRGAALVFEIELSAVSTDSIEIQIADQTLSILNRYGVALDHLAVDANGQGRAIAEVIRLRANSALYPIKVYSTKGVHLTRSGNAFDLTFKNSVELWTDMRKFIETDQIRGLDDKTINQMTSRLMVVNEKTGKQVLETKRFYRSRMSAISPSLAQSPDEADAACLTLQAAIMRLGFNVGARVELPSRGDVADSHLEAYRLIKAGRDIEAVDRMLARAGSPGSKAIKASFKSEAKPRSLLGYLGSLNKGI